MSADAAPTGTPQVRLRVELVVEIADPAVLTTAALEHLAGAEREAEGVDLRSARSGLAADTDAVATDPAEALSYLVDPFDLVKDVPGVQLAQASWGSEQIEPGAHEDGDWLDEV
ncbi:hypothetical protein LHJ74_33145 [Streptomyces sp. N2-109]|uniref:Uncharacterized protein n=1 Tax=Streptomyces gossypii TaxID=2883101 RepID=A0ABT2K3F3_9ACTN|nr:hypothetical protein [Streptomyces gossypii]MCT2594705.1 hypothetical protein [Streptomyces gossypii]